MVCGEDCMNKFDSNLFGMHPNLFWMDLNSMKYIGEVDVKLLMQISLYLGYPELGIFAWILVGTVTIRFFKILDSQSASVLNTPGRYSAVIVIHWLKILLMSTNSCFFRFVVTLNWATIIHKIFETNSSFHMKKCTTVKV